MTDHEAVKDEEKIEIQEEKVVPARMSDLGIRMEWAALHPRKVSQSMEAVVLMATLSPEVAASCFYALPRGGQTVKGPSTRLAELMINGWGNLEAAARIVDSPSRNTVMAEAFCHDLEKNIRLATSVKRAVVDRYGRPYSADMRVMTENAACSLALRNVVFKVIPRSLVDHILDACMKRVAQTESGPAKKGAEMLERLEAMGIPQNRVLAFLGLDSVSGLTAEHIPVIAGTGTALKEGRLLKEDAFRKNTESDKLDKELEGQ